MRAGADLAGGARHLSFKNPVGDLADVIQSGGHGLLLWPSLRLSPVYLLLTIERRAGFEVIRVTVCRFAVSLCFI